MSDVGNRLEMGQSSEEDGPPPPRPNRKRLRTDQTSLDRQTYDIEAQLTSLRNKETALQAEIKATHKDQQMHYDKARKTNDELFPWNNEIRKKMDALTKLKGQLPYRDETKLNQAIGRLENQLMVNNFPLREENKIIAEIDSLKRSKKSIGAFQMMEAELHQMREKQKQLRHDKDRYYVLATKAKGKEGELHAKCKEYHEKKEKLQEELQHITEQQRVLKSVFDRQEQLYQQYVDRQELRKQQQQQLQQQTIASAAQMSSMDLDTQSDTEEDEGVKNIKALLVYLSKFTTSGERSISPRDEHSPTVFGASGIAKNIQEPAVVDGMYVLKKSGDDVLFSGTSKKPRREKRKPTFTKRLSHSSEVFAQFSALGVTAPATLNDVEECMQTLTKKKHELMLGGSGGLMSGLSSGLSKLNVSGSGGGDGAPSLTDGDSILSTPEVASDRPSLLYSRRLSHDSGLCDEDEGAVGGTSSSSAGGGGGATAMPSWSLKPHTLPPFPPPPQPQSAQPQSLSELLDRKDSSKRLSYSDVLQAEGKFNASHQS